MNPAQTLSLLQSAVALHQVGRLDEADVLYAKVRRVQPQNFDANHLAGTLALQQNRLTDAADLLARAQKLNPRSAPCAMRLGATWNALGKFTEAEPVLRRASSLDPKMPEALLHLGHALRALGRIDEALAMYSRATEVSPSHAEAYEVLGAVLADTKGAAAAEPPLRMAVELQPERAVAWLNLGLVLTNLGRLGEGLNCLDRALKLDPQLHHVHAARGIALERMYELTAAVDAHARAIAGNPRNFEARSARLVALHYLDGISREALHAEHTAFGEAAGTERPREFRGDHDPERRLRVAIVSADLRAHSVAYFLEPLLANLDRERFEVFLYHDHAQTDAVSARLRGYAAQWRQVAGLTHDMLEKVILADSPDIALDLGGHTGLNRLALFARRLAPVQATYLGYPNTTGVAAMDYRLVDGVTDPEGEADAFHTEQLLRFAPTAWAYAPPDFAPAPERRATEGGVVFGCFNNFAKVSDATLRAWAQLLARVPDSRLVLKGHGLGTPALREAAQKRFAAAGLPPERVQLLERTRTQEEHLLAYHSVDIALDTFPYHGTTTTCEALWMGVPVITVAGDRHASRVGLSLLRAVGHEEWVASDWADYVSCAAKLATDPAQLAALRESLRPAMQASPLLDHAAQAARFGDALREMWRNHVAGYAESREAHSARATLVGALS